MTATIKAQGLWRRSGSPPLHAKKAGRIINDSISADWDVKFRSLRDRLPSSKSRRQGFIDVLTGGRGSGKTQAAVCLIGLYNRDERAAKYFIANELFRRLRSTFDEDGESLDREMRALCGKTRDDTLELLVIDEIHDIKNSDWENQILIEIIDQRYARELGTLLITNEQPEVAAERLGESIVDRIRESGKFLPFNWGSLRKELREEDHGRSEFDCDESR